jgi:hypothetical protein
MKHGEVTNLRTGEKEERFFCLLHVKCNIPFHKVPDGDPETPRRCPGCATLLVWNGYQFQCPVKGCHINERWGDR